MQLIKVKMFTWRTCCFTVAYGVFSVTFYQKKCHTECHTKTLRKGTYFE
jgi:hypothetical protein